MRELVRMHTIILIGVCLVVFYLPIIIAIFRKHKNFLPIFIINFFLGWTVIGWLISLIWSVKASKERVTKINKETHSVGKELQRLSTLKDNGNLTDREFEKAKEQLLTQ